MQIRRLRARRCIKMARGNACAAQQAAGFPPGRGPQMHSGSRLDARCIATKFSRKLVIYSGLGRDVERLNGVGKTAMSMKLTLGAAIVATAALLTPASAAPLAPTAGV